MSEKAFKILKFFDRCFHPEKKEVKVGTLKVADYGSFPETFIKFMSADTEEEQIFWWEILQESLEESHERRNAEILYFSYYEVAYYLQNEFIENESALAKMELHKAIIKHDMEKVSSHDYIVVLAALIHLQELLQIEEV